MKGEQAVPLHFTQLVRHGAPVRAQIVSELLAVKGRQMNSPLVELLPEAPCCGGIELAVKRALEAGGRMIPWHVVTISTDGRVYE